ncbi:hypothetical protein HHI36_011713 [Cryptolaemus montrouzieri]|uniref:Polynucleotide 5'-hydroxyl-kinase NOL9 n=1 Tax=Cryptolaemus montrouzieri TaxID=559131 RepID=A0ABD2NBZ3_9CUCU
MKIFPAVKKRGTSEAMKYNCNPISTKNISNPITKKKKKRKSIIYKPHKLQKSKKKLPPVSSFQESTTNEFNPSNYVLLKPSTSELDIYNATCQEETDLESNISVSLNKRKRICSDGRTDFPMKLFCNSNDSECDSFSIISAGLNSSNDLEEFFVHTSSGSNMCVGDINELICDGNFYERKRKKIVDENINEKNICNDSDGLNDSVDLGLKYLIENDDVEDSSGFDEPDFDIFEVDAKYIVVLKYSQTIRIFGYADLKILLGKVNILGYTLNNKFPKRSIYSPRGTALLTLKNTSKFCDDVKTLKVLVPQLSKYNEINDIDIREDSAIIMFSKTSNFKLNLIEDHISQKIVPKEHNSLCLEIEPKGTWNIIAIPQDWDQIVSSVNGSSKLFICGGKGVGKSTFMRYCVNYLLQKYGTVKVIDLDPGQSEFTVPGTISSLTITEPLLGVNYTHLKEADRSILCDINVSGDPHKYVQCIEELIKVQENANDNVFPTIVNYMGYTNDIAFHLVSSAIVLLQPSNIIYIHSSNKKKNFKVRMNRDTIIEHSKLFSPTSSMNFEMKLLKVPAVTDENTGWTLEPRQMREMCILAYFGQSMDENTNSLQSYKLPMFEVDLIDVLITDRNNVTVEPDAINANIVALCTLVNETQIIFQCFGWGIVRCIDFHSRRATIITPVYEEILNKITHLVAGCLTLPPSIYMNHENVQGKVPYVMEGELIDFAQMSKRTHIPVTIIKK